MVKFFLTKFDGEVAHVSHLSKFKSDMLADLKAEIEVEHYRRLKEENILFPGEARFTDEEITLMKMLLEDHLAKVQIIIQKINRLQREEEE